MTNPYEPGTVQPRNSNKTLVKGFITGLLILVMLIPTLFVQSLIVERKERQKEVVEEVSSKWAGAQVVSGPYIVVPYVDPLAYSEAQKTGRRNIILLPDDLNLTGDLLPEKRKRSIYNVMLYHSNFNEKGAFKVKLPADIDVKNLLLKDARICVGIKDFKGIEEKMSIAFNGSQYELLPGLPTALIDSRGLSAPVDLTNVDFAKPMPFEIDVRLKGSEMIRFMPLSANSKFALQSSWPNPSFTGNVVPSDYTVSGKGFNATWKFNSANLPFPTVITDSLPDKQDISFGVSLVQPADQYAKTERSIKYAILIIGLSFGLFFIIELLQDKPLHPLQYILVGLALIIFYTLLLSISEFISFNYAYLIAAIATIFLIGMYAQSHFRNRKTSGILTTGLTVLYGFIFALISLEDTALIVGSIALFIILALVMFVTRKINWYNPTFKPSTLNPL
ncbi:cell envelope integrity protein CreD [Danxiaibacter flavus]|uniref:Cell envelope integrity protein CreD n=1 Tax=Danxiaibacter flavus TaxID=3049108 RepID=A0ABV3Z865_9BACT|nr:cell envelope integrity protein CreD [Chitinophagaceae bacterium DXS]